MPEPLSIDQLKSGRLKALQNAKELLKEASILFDNACWARAAFLSQIVTEELGKYLILTSALIEVIVKPKSFSWKKFWRRYLSHKEKSKLISVFEDIALNNIEDFSEYFKELPTISSSLEWGRKKSLYSDYVKNAFYSPTELFTENIATDSLNRAKECMRLIKEFENNSLFRMEGMTTEEFREYTLAFQEKFKEIIGNDK